MILRSWSVGRGPIEHNDSIIKSCSLPQRYVTRRSPSCTQTILSTSRDRGKWHCLPTADWLCVTRELCLVSNPKSSGGCVGFVMYNWTSGSYSITRYCLGILWRDHGKNLYNSDSYEHASGLPMLRSLKLDFSNWHVLEGCSITH